MAGKKKLTEAQKREFLKHDGDFHPWIEPDGVKYPKQKLTAAQKKENAEFNEFFGLTEKKKTKKPAKKK